MSARLAVVVGASGGIGGAVAEALSKRPDIDHVVGLSRRPLPGWAGHSDRTGLPADITDEATLDAAAAEIAQRGTPVFAIVATGVLHRDGLQPEKTLRALNGASLAAYFAVNAIGPALVARRLLPLMPRRERSVFAVLSARVGSIGDNRLGGWYGYRASKAALNMTLKTLAIEHRRTHPEAVLAALHPGTVASDLSAPFAPKGEAGAHVLTPQASAAALLQVLDGLTAEDSGSFWGFDGRPIPW